MKYWIGLERSGSDWQWVDGSTSTYRNWANSVAPTTGCVITSAAGTAAGTWSTIDCTQRYAGYQGVICKMPASGITSTSVVTTTSVAECKLLFTLELSPRSDVYYKAI